MKIKKILLGISTSVVIFGFLSVLPASAAPVCTPTGFFRDGINMTAVKINPTAPVTGDINANDCNIGVYFGPGHSGTVNNATVHGANYFGIVAQKASVNIINSNINNIGENPLNGDQHGVGIYYATVAGITNGDCTTGTTKGAIQNNKVSVYQKAGIVADCTGTDVAITNNTVLGQGPVDYIAQNGIEVGLGAKAVVDSNKVTGNSYTGEAGAASGGILVFGGPYYGGDYTTKTVITNNTVITNDVGVYLSNLDADGIASNTNTNIVVDHNTISNKSLNNKTGNNPLQGYQAGISDQGDHDILTDNSISGAGYDPRNSSPSIFVTWIDVSSTHHPLVFANRFH